MERTRFIALAFLATSSLLACGGSSNPMSGTITCSAATATATTQVNMAGMTFTPACIKVSPGTTVTFNNNDSTSHTATADDGSFGSPTLAPGANFTHLFGSAGVSYYHCNIHPNMVGGVVVQ